jgi:spore maturation protein CgeB
VRLIGELLVAQLTDDPPDLVFALAQAPLDPEALAGIRRAGIATAFWFCEDFRVLTYWEGLARSYDVIFHIQPGEFTEPLRERGAFGVPLAMAFDPEVHRPLALGPDEQRRYRCALSFVGAGYYNRIQFLPGLFDLGLRIWGTDWPAGAPFASAMPEPNTRQSSEACNRIFNASEINLNLHSSPWCDGVNPAGDFLNPRTFELAGAGAFQLVDERSELAAHFRPGVELETFRDLAECRRKALHYLSRPDERNQIAQCGQQRALAEHSYRHRMQQALDALRAGPARFSPRRSRTPSVASVLAQAEAEPGLAAVLARLEGSRPLDADAITRAIGLGEGALSREEKLLLFMRECLGEIRYFRGGERAA